MASLPYPLCHDCTANLVGMARMPYPPTICKDYSELLLSNDDLCSTWCCGGRRPPLLSRLSGKVLGMFFLFHSILYLCIMNMLEQLARIVLPKEILDNFDIVKIETDESDIDSMSMTIYLDERMNAYLQKSEDYESKGFMDAVRITDFPIRDHKVILVLRRRRWKNKETGETFVDRISVTESGTRYSKEFAAFLKETYGHIPDDLPYA